MSRHGSRPERPLERIAFVDGVTLAARDLRDAVGYDTRLLALHIRAVHATWGVALGLLVRIRPDGRGVMVGPGYAFTCHAAVLTLETATSLDAPVLDPTVVTPHVFDVVLSSVVVSPAACGCRIPPVRAPLVCDPCGVAPGTTVRWEPAVVPVPPGPAALGPGVRIGHDVPLARMTVALDGSITGLDLSERRVARPMRRPPLAAGVLGSGDLAWSAADRDTRVSADVDTSDARFGTAPYYFVTITGARFDDPQVVGPLISVDTFDATGFTVSVAAGSPTGVTTDALITALADATVSWIAVAASDELNAISPL